MAYLAVPIRHRGQRTGSIYVTKKGGFTVEDEETLAIFASQAALVISNARRYRGEQRARADLEGLVSTAPMSVLVFDAATGAVTSLNRDARRLLENWTCGSSPSMSWSPRGPTGAPTAGSSRSRAPRWRRC